MPPACGGYLAASEAVQHVYSHARYGDNAYESRADCDWNIVAPPDHFVRLTFLTFELEPEANCRYDFVQVFGGMEGSGGNYGTFCGTKVRRASLWVVYGFYFFFSGYSFYVLYYFKVMGAPVQLFCNCQATRLTTTRLICYGSV